MRRDLLNLSSSRQGAFAGRAGSHRDDRSESLARSSGDRYLSVASGNPGLRFREVFRPGSARPAASRLVISSRGGPGRGGATDQGVSGVVAGWRGRAPLPVFLKRSVWTIRFHPGGQEVREFPPAQEEMGDG